MTSPAPGTPQTATKAVWSGVVSFLLAFAGAVFVSIKDRTDLDSMQASDWLAVIVSALVVAGGAGGVTYKARNRPL